MFGILSVLTALRLVDAVGAVVASVAQSPLVDAFAVARKFGRHVAFCVGGWGKSRDSNDDDDLGWMWSKIYFHNNKQMRSHRVAIHLAVVWLV